MTRISVIKFGWWRSVRFCITKPSKALRRGIWRNERGTSVMELAIAAPVLLVLLAGVTDLGRGLTERYRLQQAVNRSLEMAQTGRENDYAFLANEAAEAAGVPRDNVVQEQWVECAGSPEQKVWTEECSNGQPARFVKLTITSSYTPLFGSMSYWTTQSDGTVKMTAHATLRVR
jgi:Tfp pilus assembly protein PilW